MPSISIALATYNGEKYITEQLESLAAQTLSPAELVVCDDGSRDRTLELVEAFGKKAPFPVHIHRNEQRLGYRANFMKAAGLCASEFIAFCDQDDVWARHKLESVSAFFDSPDILLVYHNALIVAADLKPLAIVLPSQISKRLKCGQLPSPWFSALGHSVVFRQSLVELSDLWKDSIDLNVPSSPMAHDTWFFFLAQTLGKVRFIDQPLIFYRQHSENTCGSPQGLSQSMFRLSSLASRLAASAEWYLTSQKAAENRARILTELCRRFDESSAERLSATVKAYQGLAGRLALRRRLYVSPRLADRAYAISQIMRQGGYKGKWPWSFGRLALAKDLLLGLPFAPR